MSLKTCGRCGAYYLGGEWHDFEETGEYPLFEPARELVCTKTRVAQKTPAGLKYVDVEDTDQVRLEFRPELIYPDIRVEVIARGKISESQESPQEAREVVRVEVKRTTCDVCSQKSAGYYEALLQVRGEEDLSRELLSDIFHKLEDQTLDEQSKNREEFVSKIEEKHGGLDLYTSSAGLARHLAGVLKSEYGAKIDESAKLIGQTHDGQKKYRVSVVARLPD